VTHHLSILLESTDVSVLQLVHQPSWVDDQADKSIRLVLCYRDHPVMGVYHHHSMSIPVLWMIEIDVTATWRDLYCSWYKGRSSTVVPGSNLSHRLVVWYRDHSWSCLNRSQCPWHHQEISLDKRTVISHLALSSETTHVYPHRSTPLLDHQLYKRQVWIAELHSSMRDCSLSVYQLLDRVCILQRDWLTQGYWLWTDESDEWSIPYQDEMVSR
jgi:hypothetical protein